MKTYKKTKEYYECLELVRRDGMQIDVIDKKFRTYEMCFAAVKQNGLAIKNIKLKTIVGCKHYTSEKLQRLRVVAVNQNPEAINFVEINRMSIKYKNELFTALIKMGATARSYIDHITLNEQTNKMCLDAVNKNGMNIQHVEDQTEDICLAAIEQNDAAFIYVRNQTPRVCLRAVEKNWRNLALVKEQTEEMCMKALKQNVLALVHIKLKTEAVCNEALRLNKDAAFFID